MEELRQQYREMFGEPFLVMPTACLTDEEIEQIIRKCLAERRPYEPEMDDPNADY